MASPQLMPGATGPGQAPSHTARPRRWNHRTRPERALGVCWSWSPEGIQPSVHQPSPSPPQQPRNVEQQLDGPPSGEPRASRPSSPTLLLATRPTPTPPPQGQPQIQKPTWVSGPVMLWKIKSTDTWEALWEVVNEHQQQFNYLHISASIVHFTRLMNHGSGRQSRRPSQRYTSPGLSTPFNSACSPLSSQDGLHLPEPRTALDFLRQLLSMAITQLETFDVQGISNTIHSLAVLRHHDTSMLQSLLAAVQYRMDTGTPQNLSNIIWACVTLGFTPDRDWMALYYDAIDACISQFRPQDISNTLWAFGRLEFNGTQYKVAPDIVGKLLQQAYPQLVDFSPQHLANSMWGLARLRFVPNPAWCQAFLAVSQHQLSAMQPEELCSTVWALSRIRFRPPASWLDTAVQVSGPWLKTLDACQLSQLLTSLGSLGARPPAPWLATALGCSQRLAQTCSPLALTQMLKGLSLLGVTSAPDLDQRAVQAWLDCMLKQAWQLLGDPQPQTAAALPASSVHASQDGSGDESVSRSQQEAAAHVADSSSDSSSSGSDGQACQFTAEQLGHVLYALAGLRVQLPDPWLSKVYRSLQHSPQLLESAAKDGKVLSLVLWSLTQLVSYQQQQQQAVALAPAASQRAGSPSHSQLPPTPRLLRPSSPSPPPLPSSHLSHTPASTNGTAAAHPEQAPSSHTQEAGSSAQQQPALRHASLPPALLLALAPLTAGALRRTYGPHELALLLRAYAQAEVTPPARWLVYYWWRSLVLLGEGSVNPSALIHQLASLIHLHQSPHSTWWKGVLRTSARSFTQFRPHHYSKLIKYMAQLGYSPAANWTVRLLLSTYNVWDDMTPRDWSHLLWGLAKLQVHVPSPWMKRFYGSSHEQLSQFQPDQLAVLSWSVGKLQVKPTAAWAHAFLGTTQPQLANMSAGHLLCCVSGVSRMHTPVRTEWVRAAVAAARQHLQAGSLSPEQEQLLAMAMQRLRRRLAVTKQHKASHVRRVTLSGSQHTPRASLQRKRSSGSGTRAVKAAVQAQAAVVTAVVTVPRAAEPVLAASQPAAAAAVQPVVLSGVQSDGPEPNGSQTSSTSSSSGFRVSRPASSGASSSVGRPAEQAGAESGTHRELCSTVGVAYRST